MFEIKDTFLIAKTFHGLESVLAKEIQENGGTDLRPLTRAVKFKGDLAMLYRMNMNLSTALKIMVPILEFKANNYDEMYDQAKAYNWKDLLGPGDTFVIRPTVNSSLFTHSKFSALRLKDAIADYFSERKGRRPSVDFERPTIEIDLNITEDKVHISLNSSGDSLHRRGYRREEGRAPINEVLAAGLIKLSGWKGETHFVDPLCGTGTIAIEAAYHAHGIPPNFFRNRFGFQRWRNFDQNLYEEVKMSLLKESKKFKFKILASDMDEEAIEMATLHLKAAQIENHVELSVARMEDLDISSMGRSTVITNPPYDNRLRMDDVLGFYRTTIGDSLRDNFQGAQAWIFSGHEEGLHNIGLKPMKEIDLFNGPIPCKFVSFHVY